MPESIIVMMLLTSCKLQCLHNIWQVYQVWCQMTWDQVPGCVTSVTRHTHDHCLLHTHSFILNLLWWLPTICIPILSGWSNKLNKLDPTILLECLYNHNHLFHGTYLINYGVNPIIVIQNYLSRIVVHVFSTPIISRW